MNFFKKYSHILFEKVMRVSSSTGPFPKGLLQLELDSAKYRWQECKIGLLNVWQELNYLNHHLLTPGLYISWKQIGKKA